MYHRKCCKSRRPGARTHTYTREREIRESARERAHTRRSDSGTHMVLGLLKLPILRTLIKLPLNRHNKMGVLCLLWDFQENLQNSVRDENAFYTTVKKAGEGGKRSAVAGVGRLSARTGLYTLRFRRSAIPKVRHSEMEFLDPLFFSDSWVNTQHPVYQIKA